MPALGRYELLRPLARGGMADVYLARRRVAGVEKRLVIKRLRRDRHRDPRFLDMFIREAQLSMSLVQQNIVPVFDFGRIGDHVFLAMEYIEGRDLGSSIARERGTGMPPLLAAFIAVECCQALDHAHRRREQVIHRDVTARNVLLSWDGEVKLADFGIAAVVGQAAGTFGTPAYMAPEQANGEDVDARADVYALGIVLWEALVGDHVRPASERTATLVVARSGELPEVPATIPAALGDVIRRATQVDPAARFSTASEMAEALDSFMIVERVREGGQAPAKQLADWLAGRWGSDRGDEAAADAVPDGGAIVTFLDDGEDGIRGGAHTQRSLLETAGDDEPAPPSPDEPADVRSIAARAASPDARPRGGQTPWVGTLPLPGATRRAGTAPPVARRAGTEPPPSRPPSVPPTPRPSTSPIGSPDARRASVPPAPGLEAAPLEEADSPARLLLPSEPHEVVDPWAQEEPDAEPEPDRSRRRWLLGAIPLAIAAALALVYALGIGRRTAKPPADAQLAHLVPDPVADAAEPPDATPPPDAAEPPDAAPPPDAAIVLRPPLDAAIARPPRADAAVAGRVREMWIQALPWAYFTVDNDPKQYETPALLKLAIGAHRVTFTSPRLGVSRTVTVIVPAEGEARHIEKMD